MMILCLCRDRKPGARRKDRLSRIVRRSPTRALTLALDWKSLPILQYRYLVTVRQREFGLEYIDRAADLTEYEIVQSGYERTGDGKEKERDLPLVRQGRRGCCPLLRRDLPRQRSRRHPPRTGRLSVRQGGRCADGRIHRCRHSLPWPQRRSRVQT